MSATATRPLAARREMAVALHPDKCREAHAKDAFQVRAVAPSKCKPYCARSGAAAPHACPPPSWVALLEARSGSAVLIAGAAALHCQVAWT